MKPYPRLAGGAFSLRVALSVGRTRGMTLIELMIVVAVVAILAAIAYPNYQEQVRRSRRADAKAVLLEVAQFMERTYTESGAYNVSAGGDAISTGSASLPAALREAPKDGASKYYTITLNAVSATAYTLRATPKNGQAGDKCGTFTLTNTGAKGLTGQATGQDADSCWNK